MEDGGWKIEDGGLRIEDGSRIEDEGLVGGGGRGFASKPPTNLFTRPCPSPLADTLRLIILPPLDTAVLNRFERDPPSSILHPPSSRHCPGPSALCASPFAPYPSPSSSCPHYPALPRIR